MASQVVMPKMSDTMEEGVVVKWLKREGDRVAAGDALAEIETDKAVLELEATTPGVLRTILAQEDSKVPVGQLIAVISAEGEDVSALVEEVSPPAIQTLSPTPLTPPPGNTTSTPPAARRQASIAEEWIDASPLARRMAEKAGIDIAHVRGTGPGARVVKRDIEAFLGALRSAASSPPRGTPPAAGEVAAALHDSATPVDTGGVHYIEQELNMMRKTIARRMVLSKTTAPHFYMTSDVDMERAIALRKSLNELAQGGVKISFNDMVLKAVANALREFPRLNVSYVDDVLRQHQRVHLSMAVALDDGLITPVLRDCDRMSLGEIARAAGELIERARARRLKPEEYTGGTFSISNLGMYDIEDFGAIINPPEAAILAVGTIKEQPVVVDGQVGVGHRMKLTLSCDHRAVDGATAAQFLQIVKRLLEQPLTLML
jgi:pyruvate dehydrogenase E2 component (dihydrolipoamide acetyltransferase)